MNKPTDFSEIHVLVIDDEEFMRSMILRFLEMMILPR
jgi:hypothetical protein